MPHQVASAISIWPLLRIMPTCRTATCSVLALAEVLLLICSGLLVRAFHVPGKQQFGGLPFGRKAHAQRRGGPHSFYRGTAPGTSKSLRTVVLAGVNEAAVTEAERLGKARETLKKAVNTRKVSKEDVAAALQSLSEVDAFPDLEADDVEGTWGIVFSTRLAFGYMPVQEQVQFYPSRQKILIDTKAGPLPLGGVRGECSWEGGALNELAFNISAVQFGPIKFARDPKRKMYQFFLQDQEIMAAKSSAGSLTLLLRISE